MRLAAMEQPALRGLSPTRLAAGGGVCCRPRAAAATARLKPARMPGSTAKVTGSGKADRPCFGQRARRGL